MARLHRQNQIPDKAGFDLNQLTRLYKGWPETTQIAALQADATRLFSRKDDPGNFLYSQAEDFQSLQDAELFARSLILSRQFQDAPGKDAPSKEGKA